ncbi:MAG TPA: AraC family transcriptional regulator [Bryobacteraceae bacterium]|nr:AraC family transcriptional regulator [Bryobacteraceae bacterium]
MWDDPFRIVYASPTIRIGAFRCAPGHPLFEDSGPSRDYCFVFPRASVSIEHEDEPEFAANPNVVTFYNQGQHYRRRTISAEGDRCDWFAIAADTAREGVREYDPDVERRPEARMFRYHRAWSNPALYRKQRQLFQQLTASPDAMDPLEVEEQVLNLLDDVLSLAYRKAPQAKTAGDNLRRVEALLSRDLDRSFPLAEVAAEARLSPFHLCRAFRRATGTSLHQYRLRLRLLAALEAVCESVRPLVDIALAFGFSSHSHFTNAFRAQFNATPSAIRRSI